MRSKTAYVLSKAPYVVTGCFDLLSEIPAGDLPVTVLFHNPGWIHPVQALRRKRVANDLRKRRPVRIVFCTNERFEAFNMRMLGEEAYCLNHNMHTRENTFIPRPRGWKIRYDAIYSAQLEPFKRIALASGVTRLFVLTYKQGVGSWNLVDHVAGMSNVAHNHLFIPENEVRELYWSSACGLALSRWEGAMFASAEYLMCGIPIVSTYSRGGAHCFTMTIIGCEQGPLNPQLPQRSP